MAGMECWEQYIKEKLERVDSGGQDWVKNLEEDWMMDLISEIDIYAFQEKGLPQAPSKNI